MDAMFKLGEGDKVWFNNLMKLMYYSKFNAIIYKKIIKK